MSSIAPFAASSFAPEEHPQQLKAKESRRTGRHEPIRSSTTRIASRGAGLGVTLATGVAAGTNYLEYACSWPCWPAARSARWPPAWPLSAPGPSAGA
jgi:hypothetical protein